MKIYLPSWNGDMRLAADAENSILTLTDPTPQERVLVGNFLRDASKKGWWTAVPAPKDGEPYQGKLKDIPIHAPIAKTSKLLISISRPKDRTLTAVKFSDGKLEVIEGATSKSLEAIEASIARAKEKEDPKKEAKAASVKRPTPCCPQCMPGAIGPASEVLLSFLSPEQHEQWARERAILVEGHLSGHRYVIAHRHSELAQRVGRVCFDADDQKVVHFHDWSVPPEEEVLAAKLVMEHAEPWLRNEATVFGGGTDVYKNPFGGFSDGTESAGFAVGVGIGLDAALKMFKDLDSIK
jgi:hypothetical protein